MPEMTEVRGDQADGLRRMLGRRTARFITLVSACKGVGKTSVAINLAAALSASGARVLLIDENRGPSNIGALLGLPTRYALEQVTRGECRLEDALLSTAHGLTVLSVAGVSRAQPFTRAAASERLKADFNVIDSRFDVVLADTVCESTYGMEMFAHASHDTIVVSSAAAYSVTASYALIKRLRDMGNQQRFHVLLNRVVLEENAHVILQNLTNVAHSHLQMPIASLGCVPKDESLRRARAELRPVVDAHPASPSAVRFHCIAEAINSGPGARGRSGLIDRFMQCVLAGTTPVLAPAGV